MKTLTCLLTLTLFTFGLNVSGQAVVQGRVQLNNRIVGIIDAPFVLPDGTRPAGPAYTAELALVINGSAVPITPSTVFRSNMPAAAGYVIPMDVAIPGVTGDTRATLILRAYATSAGSYENAVASGMHHGQSNPLILRFYGSNLIPPADLLGLGWASADSQPVEWVPNQRPGSATVFPIQMVPEPSTVTFALVGLAALFLPTGRWSKNGF
jgi:hypothetical protein